MAWRYARSCEISELRHLHISNLQFSLYLSLVCYQQNTTSSCFNITAGDYNLETNITVTNETCVKACSTLNIGITFAALTTNGICLCTKSNEICLAPVPCIGMYYEVYPVAMLPTLNVTSMAPTFDEFSVAVDNAGNLLGLQIQTNYKMGNKSSSTRQPQRATHACMDVCPKRKCKTICFRNVTTLWVHCECIYPLGFLIYSGFVGYDNLMVKLPKKVQFCMQDIILWFNLIVLCRWHEYKLQFYDGC